MGQCKSKDWDFKSYANAALDVAADVCPQVWALRLSERTQDNASLRAKTKRDYRGYGTVQVWRPKR
jgi:hypothetical protein